MRRPFYAAVLPKGTRLLLWMFPLKKASKPVPDADFLPPIPCFHALRPADIRITISLPVGATDCFCRARYQTVHIRRRCPVTVQRHQNTVRAFPASLFTAQPDLDMLSSSARRASQSGRPASAAARSRKRPMFAQVTKLMQDHIFDTMAWCAYQVGIRQDAALRCADCLKRPCVPRQTVLGMKETGI